jgi:hypothetical protein
MPAGRSAVPAIRARRSSDQTTRRRNPRRRCSGPGLADLTHLIEEVYVKSLPEPSAPRAAIYVRVSTGGQEDNSSPVTQVDPGIITAELYRLSEDDPTEADLAAVDRALDHMRRQRANLVGNLALVDEDTAAVIREQLAAVSQQVRSLEAERQQILERQQARREAASRLGELEAWCRTVAANLGSMTYERRRLALDALGVTVTIWHADQRPRYRIEASIPLGGDDGGLAVSTSRSGATCYTSVRLSWTLGKIN